MRRVLPRRPRWSQAISRRFATTIPITRNNATLSPLPVVPVTAVDSQGRPLAYIPLDSPLNYNNRLKSGAFHNGLELLNSPYAPGPLKVLSDMIELSSVEVARRRDACHDRTTSAYPILQKQDVEFLLTKAADDLREATVNWKELGDVESSTQYIRLMDKLTEFERRFRFDAADEGNNKGKEKGEDRNVSGEEEGSHTLHHMTTTSSEGNSSLSTLLIDIGDAQVHGTFLKLYIELAGVSGRWESAVVGLYELMDLVDSIAPSAAAGPSLAVQQEEIKDLQSLLDPSSFTQVIEACAPEHKFDTARSVFLVALKRFAFDRQAGDLAQRRNEPSIVTPASHHDLTPLATALAMTCRGKAALAEYRALFVDHIADRISPSVHLYSSIIGACGRAGGDDETAMPFALSLYRTLRDVQLLPSPETYTSLLEVCASAKEPTKAFSFFHEAKKVHGRGQLSPALNTALLRSYVEAGQFNDAKMTFDVLVSSGSPMTRQTFHVLLAGAPDEVEANKLVDAMTQAPHNMIPTASTLKYVLDARMRGSDKRGGPIESLLFAFDLHVRALRLQSVMRAESALGGGSGGGCSATGSHQETGLCSVYEANDVSRLTKATLEHLPGDYVQSLEDALLKMMVPKTEYAEGEILTKLQLDVEAETASVEPARDRDGNVLSKGNRRYNSRSMTKDGRMGRASSGKARELQHLKESALLRKCVQGCIRPCQFSMNDYLGNVPPQAPSKLPKGCAVAVLSPDVLLTWTDVLTPDLIKYFSSIVVPYSAIVAARKVALSQGKATVFQSRIKSLITTHRSRLHLVSLNEEFHVATDMARWELKLNDPSGRCAGFAACLARGLTTNQAYKDSAAGLFLLSTEDKTIQRTVVGNPLLSRYVTHHNCIMDPDWRPPTDAMAESDQSDIDDLMAGYSVLPPTVTSAATNPFAGIAKTLKSKRLQGSEGQTSSLPKSAPRQTASSDHLFDLM